MWGKFLIWITMVMVGGKMKVRVVLLFCMLGFLFGVVLWEQIFIDNTLNELFLQSNQLYASLEKENLVESKALANKVHKYWKDREGVISLIEDYRDIEQIGKQSSYIIAYLNDEDFELARSECLQFMHLLQNFSKMVKFDMHNVF